MITCMVPYHTVTVLIWYIDTFLIHSGMGMHMHVQHHVLDGHYTTQLPADPLFVCQVRHDVSSMSRVTPADCRGGHAYYIYVKSGQRVWQSLLYRMCKIRFTHSGDSVWPMPGNNQHVLCMLKPCAGCWGSVHAEVWFTSAQG